MASLRNAIPQRPYRERAQPESRARLGILEKHKDYSARAKDYNAKKARLKILRQKATDRNPDEFHFGMMSSRTKDGIKIGDRGAKVLSYDVVKLMKTQDAGYLRTVKERIRREIARLEETTNIASAGDRWTSNLINDQASVDGKRLVFVENEEEQKSFDTADAVDQEGQRKTDSFAKGQAARQLTKSKQEQERRRLKLAALRKQEKELGIAEQELDLQRAQMSHTVGGVNKNGVKFKVRERAR